MIYQNNLKLYHMKELLSNTLFIYDLRILNFDLFSHKVPFVTFGAASRSGDCVGKIHNSQITIHKSYIIVDFPTSIDFLLMSDGILFSMKSLIKSPMVLVE